MSLINTELAIKIFPRLEKTRNACSTHLEWLFLEKGGETIARRHFFNDLHNHHILIDLSRDRAVQWSKFVLIRRHFSVTCAQRNSQIEALALDFLHACQCGGG